MIHLFHNSTWGVVRDSEGRYIKGFNCFSPMFFFDGEVDGVNGHGMHILYRGFGCWEGI